MKNYLTIMVLILSANAYACDPEWEICHKAAEKIDRGADDAWNALKSVL